MNSRKLKMKKILLILSILACTTVFADTVTPIKKPTFNPVSWSSPNASSEITIQNSAGRAIAILIAVDNISAMRPVVDGINVKNCSGTTHINPGSAAICYTSDPQNPVTFSADNKTGNGATGSYQIERQ